MILLESFLVVVIQIIFGLLYYSPIILPFALVWGFVFVETKVTPQCGRWRLFLLGCLPPFAIPLAIGLCGVAFADESPWIEGVNAKYAEYLIFGLLLAHLPYLLIALYWWGEQAPAIWISSCYAGGLSFLAYFISYMSIEGVWL